VPAQAWWLVLLALLLAGGRVLAAEPAKAPPQAGGIIEGTVTYRPDAARPWRYMRYYVKNSRGGPLAEAVVALRGRALAAAAPAPGAQTVVIDQQGFQFVPETVAIRVGDSVKFTNSDETTHNVQTNSEIATFNVNTVGGGSQTHRFDRAGGTRQFARIGCVFHSGMRAFVFVFDHPFFQLTEADGQFRFAGVPPGEYELELAHPSGELRWRQKVELAPGGRLQIDIALSPDDKK